MSKVIRRHATWLFPLLLAPLVAQIDQAAAARELAHVFDRPAGRPIGAEGKRALAEFLQKYEGQDLGPLGYARALQLYLDRDYTGAVAELDRFLTDHDTVANDEHRSMVGRVYLNALVQGARAGNVAPELLALHAERAARLYGDLGMIARAARVALDAGGVDRAALRVGLLRGALQSGADSAAVDVFCKGLYGDAAIPAAAVRAPREARAVPAAAKAPADLTGATVPAVPALHVLNGGAQFPDAASFSLEKLRDKVVVLDFTATWCPPCRGVVPRMVALQQRHAPHLQVVAVTRFYGRGMDFSDPAAEKNHGGKSVANLSEAEELKVNEAFVRAFEINYPVVVAGPDVARDAFHVSGIPTVFVVGRDGKVTGAVVGAKEEEIDALVEKAMLAK